eukprot:1004628_1
MGVSRETSNLYPHPHQSNAHSNTNVQSNVQSNTYIGGQSNVHQQGKIINNRGRGSIRQNDSNDNDNDNDRASTIGRSRPKSTHTNASQIHSIRHIFLSHYTCRVHLLDTKNQ